MNSRERVLAALNHEEPDRVAVDLGGHRSSGMHVIAYKKLREYLGLAPSKLFIYDLIQQLAIIENDVLDIFGIDVVELGHNFYNLNEYWQDWELDDGTTCKIPAFIKVEKTQDGNVVYGDEEQVICIQKKGCLFFEQTYFPFLNSNDFAFKNLPYHLQQIMWVRLGMPPAPAGFDEEGLRIWRDTAVNIRKSTDRAIYGTFGGNLIEIGEFAFRMDNFLYSLAAEPTRVHTFLDKLVEIHLKNLDKYLDATAEYIDIIGFGDDFGTQQGPQISPKMYQEFFKPRHKVLWDYVKQRAPHLKISLHSCGGIYPLIRDLIEAGVDAINPVQFTSKDMCLHKLKKEFGKDLTLWGGGCDTRSILPFGTPEEVKPHVKENVKILSPGGGFVFQQVHNIMAEVPPQNVVAMFEALREINN
ncbi:MAG TPA: uroporphyrinogen decarboxylase family protein [Spirochaetia bacterium]|nr:uroporphyrinogen decarboxylase family protein [Spirochaetia bacterium]